MIRLIIFTFNIDEEFVDCKGMNSNDYEDLRKKNFDGYIELRQAEKKRIKKASERAKKATIYTH